VSQIPPPSTPEGYFIPTLNRTGFMSAWVSDEFMKAFIEFAPRAPGPVLDVGAAYGVATLPALAQGAKVIANDSNSQHLQILQERTPASHKQNLTLLPGLFPELKIAPNSLGAILIARVLHFFDGDLIRKAFLMCNEWLMPGGRLILTAETPYLKNIQSFIPEYEKRCQNQWEWPGLITDFPRWDLRGGENLPSQMHLLDEKVLQRELTRSGFNPLSIKSFARPEFPESLKLDGRESVGAIAEKP